MHFVFLHSEPRGWEVGPGEGDTAEMGPFSDLGSSSGMLRSPEAVPLPSSKAGIWLWLQELLDMISQAELSPCVISSH